METLADLCWNLMKAFFLFAFGWFITDLVFHKWWLFPAMTGVALVFLAIGVYNRAKEERRYVLPPMPPVIEPRLDRDIVDLD